MINIDMRIDEILGTDPPDHTEDMPSADVYWRNKEKNRNSWSDKDHAAYKPYLMAKVAGISTVKDTVKRQTDLPSSPPSNLKIVYHGTSQKFSKRIMKHGLVPQINKYATTPDSFGVGGQETWSPEDLADITVVSTTTNFSEAKSYASWGGSTGDNNSPGMVFSFIPRHSDRVKNEGYTGSKTEWSFYNTISPDRLTVVWPKKSNH